jgi:hypothetical protein
MIIKRRHFLHFLNSVASVGIVKTLALNSAVRVGNGYSFGAIDKMKSVDLSANRDGL